jgi:hypothetical protein
MNFKDRRVGGEIPYRNFVCVPIIHFLSFPDFVSSKLKNISLYNDRDLNLELRNSGRGINMMCFWELVRILINNHREPKDLPTYGGNQRLSIFVFSALS